MASWIRAFSLALLGWFGVATVSAQQIVVNELFRNGNLTTTDEWVEYVSLEDLTATQLETFFFGDSTGTTASKFGAFRLTNMATLAPIFRRGTIIVLAGQTGPAEDLSYDPTTGNFELIFRTNNARVVTVTGGADLAGDDVAWVDTASTGSTIAAGVGFCVTWDGTPAPGALGVACGLTLPFNLNNSGIRFNGFFDDIATVANWSTGITLASLTPGQPNGGDNSTAIAELRAPTLSISNASVTEGNPPGTTLMTFTASLSFPSAGSCDFNIETLNAGTANDATANVDYTSETALAVSIPAGQISQSFNITILRDTLTESSEVFLASAFGEDADCTIDGQGTGTINDDDLALPTLSIGDVNVVEGNSGFSNAVFTVTRSSTATAVTVDFGTANGSATAGSDFTTTAGTLNFAAGGAATATISVPVAGEVTFEPNENFFVNLSNPVGATLLDGQGEGVISNDDNIAISISDVNFTEGNSGSANALLTVTRSDTSTAISVDFSTADGTASNASDYTQSSGAVNFIAGGAATASISVPVLGDTNIEPDETFFVNINSKSNGVVIADGQGLATIVNDDGSSLSISDATLVEGNAGASNMVFTVSRTNTTSAVTVDFTTANASATAGSDFTLTSGTLNFAAGGAATGTISVPITGDTTVEANESFVVNLSNPSGATITDGEGQGTIDNDDSATLLLSSIALAEGNAGNTAFVFQASLSNPVQGVVTASVNSADGNNANVLLNATTADNDYLPVVNGTLSFASGSTTASSTVQVVGDTEVEPNQGFRVLMSNLNVPAGVPAGAVVLGPNASGTINNDDGTSLSIDSAGVVEGNTGTSVLNFNVLLSAPNKEPVTVNFATSDGTATAGVDYVARTGTLTIPANATSAQLAITINGELVVEGNETFVVTLSAPTGATLAGSVATGTINNDDSAVLALNNVVLAEGNAGNSAFVFTASLSNPVQGAITASVNTADGNNVNPLLNATIADNDYIALTAGSLNFAAGATSLTSTVQVVGDTEVEPNQSFRVLLSNLQLPASLPAGSVSLGSNGLGTINNDDGTILSVANASINEGNAGSSLLNFTVSLTAQNKEPVTVNFATSNGTATAGSDYVARTGTLTIPANTQSAQIGITINGDTEFEANETFTLTLTTPVGATLGAATATGTITNDDALSLAIADSSTQERDLGLTQFNFVVTLSGQTALPVRVNFATENGTAVFLGDYVSTSGVLEFLPGVNSQTITVNVNGDRIPEDNETFLVRLSNPTPTGVTLSRAVATGTIINDDAGVPVPALDWRGLLVLVLAVGSLALLRQKR
jgi:hypothetical protein